MPNEPQRPPHYGDGSQPQQPQQPQPPQNGGWGSQQSGQQPQHGGWGSQQQPQFGPPPQQPQWNQPQQPSGQQTPRPQVGSPQQRSPQSGTVVRGSLGCISGFLTIFLWVLMLGCLVLVPGSIVWAVLVEMGRHGAGPFKLDSWVNGSFKNTFGPPAAAFGFGIVGFFTCLDQLTPGSSSAKTPPKQ